MKQTIYLLTILFIPFFSFCSENNIESQSHDYKAEVVKKAGVKDTFFFGHSFNGLSPNSPVDLANHDHVYFKNTLQLYLNFDIPTLKNEASNIASTHPEYFSPPPIFIDENFNFETSPNGHVTLIQLAILSRRNKIFITPSRSLIPEDYKRNIAIIKIYTEEQSDFIDVNTEELTSFLLKFNQNNLSTENLENLTAVDEVVYFHVQENRTNQ